MIPLHFSFVTVDVVVHALFAWAFLSIFLSSQIAVPRINAPEHASLVIPVFRSSALGTDVQL